MDQAAHPVMPDNAVLSRFRAAVHALYGSRLERAVLFGSRARGDARPDSDYDVAIFLRDYTRAWPEIQPLGRITTEILQDTGALISALPFPAGSYQDRTMLMEEIRREGVEL